MRNSRISLSVVAAVCFAALLIEAGPAAAADPGAIVPITSEASDQKSGSVLFFPLFTSSAVSPATQDTRVSLTNNSDTSAAFLRLFFVDGGSGLPADTSVCLTANQTIDFDTSTLRPGETGYLVAVAVDPIAGLPLEFDFLSGQAQIKMASGHRGSLGAIAFAKQTATNVVSTDGTLAALFFDGLALAGSYNRAPRVLQLPNIPSSADGSTLLIVNRLGGNLATGAASIGTLTGTLFDDAENAFGFAVPSAGPQLIRELSDTFPVTAPNFTSVIPAGRSGWMKFNSQSDVGFVGSVLYLTKTTTHKGNRTTTTTSSAGGANLRALTLSAAANIVIPVAPPSCFVP